MSNERILIVDDEPEIIRFMKLYLDQEGFAVFTAGSGSDALRIVRTEPLDLIVLDVMLPDIDGNELCLAIRRVTDAPIIFVSCRSNDIDKVLSLSAGGDDYMTKPFSPLELIARIRAHLRRSRILGDRSQEAGPIELPGLSVNIGTREVFADGVPVALSAKEFEILALLLGNPKRIYTVEQIYEAVWKENALEGDSRTIIVYIGNIRKKIEPDPSSPKYIMTVRGVGYKFNHNLPGLRSG